MGRLQLPVAAAAVELVRDVAVVGRVEPPEAVNVVEVAEMFQPAPEPVRSDGVSTREAEEDVEVPLIVVDGKAIEDGAESERLPPEQEFTCWLSGELVAER